MYSSISQLIVLRLGVALFSSASFFGFLLLESGSASPRLC